MAPSSTKSTSHSFPVSKGTLGSLLKGLLGYNGNPSLLEVLAYWTYLFVVGTLFLGVPNRTRLVGGRREAVSQS